MEKQMLLRRVVETAYNVGFGAKKNFSTFDIIEKAPGVIGFLSLAVGVFALAFDFLNNKFLSATMIVLGISVLYTVRYSGNRTKYEEEGKRLTGLFNELKRLFFKIKSKNGNFSKEEKELNLIEKKFNKQCVVDQIVLSDWYAHYKFFWQHQIDWLNEELKFGFWRDKLPLSLTVSVLSGAIVLIFIYLAHKP